MRLCVCASVCVRRIEILTKQAIEICAYTLRDIRLAVVLVKIRMESNEYFLNIELLNELITQNIIIFDQKWQVDRSRNN